MRFRVRHLAMVVGCGCLLSGRSPADDFRLWVDPPGDAVVRKTAWGKVDSDKHHLPDLLRIKIGTWQPQAPATDLFAGEWDKDADEPFLRVDIVVAGLMNPPGPLRIAPKGEFDPFRFGPHPLFGYVELDVDSNIDTGGELRFPEHRFLGMAARFGGIASMVPRKLKPRFALGGDDLDGKCRTEPLVEYSGEEFHIALLGKEYRKHRVIEENKEGRKGRFDAGEVWVLDAGTWLHRAHGFKDFSFTCPHSGFCIGDDLEGEYMPDSTLRWGHDRESDETTISLVFPLTQRAAGAMHDQEEERIDRNFRNQASVHEALADLLFSARTVDRKIRCSNIIIPWKDTDPQDFLRPAKWRVDAGLSTSFTKEVRGKFFVFTDIYPNVRPGDFDGDDQVDLDDYRALYDFILTGDGQQIDCDGEVNGQVCLADFPADFSVFDIDYNDDGIIGPDDAALVVLPHDLDRDGDVDLDDLRLFVVKCLLKAPGPRPPDPPLRDACIVADSDFDGDVDLYDFARFQKVYTGPDP